MLQTLFCVQTVLLDPSFLVLVHLGGAARYGRAPHERSVAHTIGGMTVQLFTIEDIALELCREHAMIPRICNQFVREERGLDMRAQPAVGFCAHVLQRCGWH